MAASILDMIFRARQEGVNPADVANQLGAVEKKGGLLGTVTKGLNVGMLALGGAMAFVGSRALQVVGDLVDTGLQFQRSQLALQAYTGSAEAAAEATKAVQDAVGGGLSKMAATESATKLFAMGLANTSEKAAELTDIAVTLGAT